MENILLACSLYWIVFALIINVKSGFMTKILFKVIPFLTGVITCLVAMNLMGWVNIWQG